MTLLELNSEDLRQRIESEIAVNPALDLLDDPHCPHCHRVLPAKGPCPTCSAGRVSGPNDPIVFISPRADFVAHNSRLDDEGFSMEEITPAVDDLPAYVMRQIAPELSARDRPIAAHILTGLDEDGLLTIPLIEIARYHHTSLAQVEDVLRLIQHADPIGVGSPDPQQALLVQLEVLGETRRVPELATQAITKGMLLLSRRAYVELGSLLNVSVAEAQEIAQFISDNLNPYPARAHWGEIYSPQAPTSVYREPDILIARVDETEESALMVEIVSPYSGSLRINPLFKQAIAEAPGDKVEEWQEHLETASLLIKCIQQRDHTLVRLMQRLVVLQRGFLLGGDAEHLPITRAQLADELQVHESTISRAVAGKAVQLPNLHIIPLSRLFDRSLHVRTALMKIISTENEPLSDTQIAELLMQQGFPVARRTVAKYRAIEGILPARLRRPSGPQAAP
jgi:RNA polymerase sigma-54 factor